ncbi:MAG: HAD hydrolase-like protein [Spirochaetes bacterium]|nr:HAD hydrolase-like protein [Spirochaetota bacterium]
MKVILFDIDGTLLRCDGAGKRSMMRACIDVFGTAGGMEDINFQGKTDLYLIRQSLIPAGLDETEVMRGIGELRSRYTSYLSEAMRNGAGTLLPGVPPLLERLSAAPGTLLGVLTGNFRSGAAVKLERFDLGGFFRFGVYGDDVTDRNEMPPVARDLARAITGVDLSYGDMVIVGDTSHDIECARSVSAVSLCVGTGWDDRENLIALEPDFYFDDLGDTDAVVRAILPRHGQAGTQNGTGVQST